MVQPGGKDEGQSGRHDDEAVEEGLETRRTLEPGVYAPAEDGNGDDEARCREPSARDAKHGTQGDREDVGDGGDQLPKSE